MDNFKVCRVCLVGLFSNAVLYKIEDTPLQDIYEAMTNSELRAEGPNRVCSLCLAVLKRGLRVRQLAAKSQKLLTHILQHGIQEETASIVKDGMLFNLCVIQPVHVTLPPPPHPTGALPAPPHPAVKEEIVFIAEEAYPEDYSVNEDLKMEDSETSLSSNQNISGQENLLQDLDSYMKKNAPDLSLAILQPNLVPSTKKTLPQNIPSHDLSVNNLVLMLNPTNFLPHQAPNFLNPAQNLNFLCPGNMNLIPNKLPTTCPKESFVGPINNVISLGQQNSNVISLGQQNSNLISLGQQNSNVISLGQHNSNVMSLGQQSTISSQQIPNTLLAQQNSNGITILQQNNNNFISQQNSTGVQQNFINVLAQNATQPDPASIAHLNSNIISLAEQNSNLISLVQQNSQILSLAQEKLKSGRNNFEMPKLAKQYSTKDQQNDHITSLAKLNSKLISLVQQNSDFLFLSPPNSGAAQPVEQQKPIPVPLKAYSNRKLLLKGDTFRKILPKSSPQTNDAKADPVNVSSKVQTDIANQTTILTAQDFRIETSIEENTSKNIPSNIVPQKKTKYYMNKDGLYPCKVCDKLFSTFNSRQEHTAKHSVPAPFTCKLCKRSFVRQSHIDSHMKIHLNEKLMQCNICDDIYSDINKLKSHMRCHILEEHWCCRRCHSRFMYMSDLMTHLRARPGCADRD